MTILAIWDHARPGDHGPQLAPPSWPRAADLTDVFGGYRHQNVKRVFMLDVTKMPLAQLADHLKVGFDWIGAAAQNDTTQLDRHFKIPPPRPNLHSSAHSFPE